MTTVSNSLSVSALYREGNVYANLEALFSNKYKQLEDNPYLGITPRYPVLKRQGYQVLILEKDLIFYKINENKKQIIIYSVVDQRQDYLNIIQGL